MIFILMTICIWVGVLVLVIGAALKKTDSLMTLMLSVLVTIFLMFFSLSFVIDAIAEGRLAL